MKIARVLLVLVMLSTACICGCWYKAMFSQPLPQRLSVRITSINRQAEKDGLDPNQLRLAVERVFRNRGVEIVEPNSPAQLPSRLLINLDVQQDPNTQLYTCKVELCLFHPTGNPKKPYEAVFKTGPDAGTQANAADMPEATREKVGAALFGLALFYLPDEEKDQFILDLFEGFFLDLNSISLPDQSDCQSMSLENKQRKG